MSTKRGSGCASANTVLERTVAEAVRRTKHAAKNDPMFVPPSDDVSFILSLKAFATRGQQPLALRTLTIDNTHLTGGAYDGTADVTLATDATAANTASTIVARDASKNFAAGTITATFAGDISGTNATATNGNVTHMTVGDLTSGAVPIINVVPTAGVLAGTHSVPIVFNGVTYHWILHN